MSAAEVIEMIKKLPPEERAEVVAFARNELVATPVAEKRSVIFRMRNSPRSRRGFLRNTPTCCVASPNEWGGRARVSLAGSGDGAASTVLGRTWGIDGARDPGAIESALASAQNTWLYADGDLHDIAAAYAFHIAEAQAFLDGNKRTAISTAIAFLHANGCMDHSEDGELYEAMIAISARRMDKAGLAAVLRRHFPGKG